MVHNPAADDISPGPGKLRYMAAVAAGSFDDDRATIIRLWNSGLARNQMAEAKLRWYYQRNPEGVHQHFFLRSDVSPKAVGVVALARRRMRLGAESLVAGFILDFVVEPEDRRSFPE